MHDDMTVWFVVAACCYLTTASLGIGALMFNRSFGRLHHGAFMIALITGLTASYQDVGADTITATLILIIMPFCPARTIRHRALGIIGCCIYIIGSIMRISNA